MTSYHEVKAMAEVELVKKVEGEDEPCVSRSLLALHHCPVLPPTPPSLSTKKRPYVPTLLPQESGKDP